MNDSKPLQRSKTTAIDSYLQNADFSTEMHPAMQATSLAVQQSAITHGWQYDNVQETKVKEEAECLIKRHEERFLDAPHAFQDNAKPKYQTGVVLELSTMHSWPEVLQAVAAVQIARAERPGFWPKLTNKLQCFGEHSAVFEQWTQLLPTQSQYFSVLCGGLKLIIGAASRLKEVREWICDTLLELPVLLSCTDKTLDMYENVDLHVCCRKLMAKTFESLQWIVVELTRSAAKKGPMAFLKQESYAHKLRDSLDDIKKLSEQFDRIAVTCDRAKLDNVEKIATSTKSQLSFEHSVTNANVVYTGEAVVSELKSYLAGVVQQFKTDVASELMAFLSSQIDSRQQLLIEQAPPPPKVLSREERERNEARERTKQAKRRAYILHALNYDEAVLRADLEENVRAMWTSGIVAQDRVHFLLGEHQLAYWLAEPSNTILLVNGNNLLSPERDTSVSFVAAKLIQTISTLTASHNDANIVSMGLYFFCADHIRNADRLAGPAGLLQSFIGQLVSSYECCGLKSLREEAQRHGLGTHDMRRLWAIFETMVCKLPRTAVLYCVLDSITEYEFSPWRQETGYLVDSLIALSRRLAQEDTCVMKVLFTSPLTSRSIHHNLERWEVLDMPEQVPAVGGFSDSAWDASGISGFFEHKKK